MFGKTLDTLLRPFDLIDSRTDDNGTLPVGRFMPQAVAVCEQDTEILACAFTNNLDVALWSHLEGQIILRRMGPWGTVLRLPGNCPFKKEWQRWMKTEGSYPYLIRILVGTGF